MDAASVFRIVADDNSVMKKRDWDGKKEWLTHSVSRSICHSVFFTQRLIHLLTWLNFITLTYRKESKKSDSPTQSLAQSVTQSFTQRLLHLLTWLNFITLTYRKERGEKYTQTQTGSQKWRVEVGSLPYDCVWCTSYDPLQMLNTLSSLPPDDPLSRLFLADRQRRCVECWKWPVVYALGTRLKCGHQGPCRNV